MVVVVKQEEYGRFVVSMVVVEARERIVRCNNAGRKSRGWMESEDDVRIEWNRSGMGGFSFGKNKMSVS